MNGSDLSPSPKWASEMVDGGVARVTADAVGLSLLKDIEKEEVVVESAGELGEREGWPRFTLDVSEGVRVRGRTVV